MGVVLIAFERESEQSALEQMLAGKGHRVVRSGNGLAALDAARREPPDLIVSDIVLPRMDGFALCRKWKQDERLQTIPFVFYTRRHNDPKYERFALELGAERFLARSTPQEALLTAVGELLADAPARRQATAPLPVMDELALKREAAKQAQAQARAQQEAAQKQLEQAQSQARAQLDALNQQLEQAQRLQTQLRSQVDDLQAAQQRLVAGEARFRRVFDANPLPMWMVDRETGGFVAVNEAALALFGYARAEFLALKSENLRMAGAQAQPGMQMHQRKDGVAVALATASRQVEFDGRAADLVCAFDLSERLAAERQLQAQASGHRAVLDAAADGVLALDPHGKVLEANAAYCRMLGYTRTALLGKNVAELEDQSVGETTMRLQLGRVRGGARYETKHRRADGGTLDVEVSVGLLEGADGGSVMLVRDMTQRRRDLIAQRTQQRQSEALLELFRAADSLDESALTRRVLEIAADALRSPLTFVLFVQPRESTIALGAWRDASGRMTMADGEPRPIAGSLFTECVRARQITMSNDASAKPQADGLPELHRYLAAPLLVDGEIGAVLGAANRDAGYADEDEHLLAAIADAAQRVLQAKRAHVRIMRDLQRTDVALQALIDSFVRVSERHDPYTAGSARRLAALAVALGREAGLDGQRQHGLRIAALLHDVGNIAVPASILSKPAPLTETELALMRSHVEEGCQLLAEIDFGAPVADIVYQSHERWDGSGYPRGLKGEEIMIEARILGIADTVEAMCSPRPYRPAAGMDAAIEELNRGAGRLYDPHLVAACTRLVRQHGFTLPE